jgi:hypothetical protein
MWFLSLWSVVKDEHFKDDKMSALDSYYCNFFPPIQRVLNNLYMTRLSCRLMNWLLVHATPPPSPFSKLSLFLSLPVELTDGRGGGGGWGAKSYDGKKAWSSINPSILSAPSLRINPSPTCSQLSVQIKSTPLSWFNVLSLFKLCILGECCWH